MKILLLWLTMTSIGLGADYRNPFDANFKWMIKQLPGAENGWVGDLKNHLRNEHQSPKDVLLWSDSTRKSLHNNLHNYGKSGVYIVKEGKAVYSSKDFGQSGFEAYQTSEGQEFKVPRYTGGNYSSPSYGGCGNGNCQMCYGRKLW